MDEGGVFAQFAMAFVGCIAERGRHNALVDEQWVNLGVVILPSGHVALGETGERVPTAVAGRIRKAYEVGAGELLFHLATEELQTSLSSDFAYLREFGREYVTAACHAPVTDEGLGEVGRPGEEWLGMLAMRCPPVKGSENLTRGVLGEWWELLDERVREVCAETEGGLAAVLAKRSPAWRMVGRVTFHLAENKKDPDRPFAFMATYTSRLSAAGRPQHLPLARALQEYAGAGNREALLKLLVPVNDAAGRGAFVKQLVESGAIYRAVAWKPKEAYQFLQEIPVMEGAGLVVRVPEWWKAKRPGRPMVSARIGEKKKAGLSAESLLDFDMAVTLEGQELSEAEVRQLLASTSGLVRIRGQWVELDKEKLQKALEHWKKVEQTVGQTGVSFSEAMRLLSGAEAMAGGEAQQATEAEWVGLSAGTWLSDALKKLRMPQETEEAQHPELQATLRPYQKAGVAWLRFVTQLGLGACLADDMGLGKTMQVITLLLHLRSGGAADETEVSSTRTGMNSRLPSLLVAPASLLGNWRAELARFTPTLRAKVVHPSEIGEEEAKAIEANPVAALGECDLVITTYGMLHRTPWLMGMKWRLVILDEAQAIKNASTRQAQMTRKLQASARVALTGTPVENRLGDLWSLFDFLNPGLLGSAKAFTSYTKKLASAQTPDYAPLRTLIGPYILRRLKTDKTIIADLPEKTEMKAYCTLGKRQAVLYQEAVEELADQIATAEGIARKGLILATLLKLKQICNHPSQWLGDGEYKADESGKFGRLRELCEELAERQQKVLVFTQFREITAPLAEYLQGVFGRSGLVLHGQVAVGQRKKLVDEFQREDGPPFFVLSIKAGGTGLNLTAASTVIHFDRWWNPAVENQATDRAFRIGQKQNVLVHKFVCQGTVEEKIDRMIEEKIGIAKGVLDAGGETLLTEMDDKQLLQLLSLDLERATEG